ncbi:MAG: hypothetical protein HYY48_03745 [Gammaproteobacteria bacterium]|nr:hypothetical protein [Gammaproteobacteria bacterium]
MKTLMKIALLGAALAAAQAVSADSRANPWSARLQTWLERDLPASLQSWLQRDLSAEIHDGVESWFQEKYTRIVLIEALLPDNQICLSE